MGSNSTSKIYPINNRNNLSNLVLTLLFILFSLLCFSCASLPNSYSRENAGEVVYKAVKINLQDENLFIKTYPDESTAISNEGFIKGISITSFFNSLKLDENTSSVIINTSPYSSHGTILDRKIFHSKLKPLGIFQVGKKRFSEVNNRYAMLLLSQDDKGYKAKIIAHQNELDIQNSYKEALSFVIGGYFVVLKDGELFDSTGNNFAYTSQNARTAIGIADEGKSLILLCVEGKKKSKGLSYPECAKLLKSMGATDALQFDGGTSSAMLIDGKNPLISLSKRKNTSYIAFLFCNKEPFD